MPGCVSLTLRLFIDVLLHRLVPLLDQLPWEAGVINLGKTEEERIAEVRRAVVRLVEIMN